MTKTEVAATDLSAFDTTAACNKPVEIELLHPVNRNGLGIFWSVLGKDSDVYRGRVRALADESIRRSNAGLPPLDNSLSKIEAKNIDTLAAATTGFRSADKGEGVLTLNGVEYKYSVDTAKELLTKLPALREQVQEAVNDLGKFMPD